MIFEDRTTVVKGLRTCYRIAGDPKDPLIVFLNGWGVRVRGPILDSEGVIRELAHHKFYVCSPEAPGLMRSETPKALWGPHDFVEWLEEFVKKLGLEEFILIGQSFGGAIATLYAAEYQKRVKTLILVSAGLSSDKKIHLVFKRRKYFSWILRVTCVPELLKRALVFVYLGVPWKTVKKEDFESRSIMWNIFANWSLPNVYAEIQMRAILVWGRYDLLFPLSSAKKVAQEIPQAELVVVTGGHSVLYARPKRIVGIIANKI